VETDLDSLRLLAEVTIGFVSFSAIVASLRLYFGSSLSPFQRLLVHFFVETGMLFISATLLPLVLVGFWQDEFIVAEITIVYILFSSCAYLVSYIRRRIAINAPTPLLSLLVMIGYGIWIPFLAIIAVGAYWQPSLEIIVAYCYWGLIGSALIFSSFLTSFIRDPAPSAPAENSSRNDYFHVTNEPSSTPILPSCDRPQ